MSSLMSSHGMALAATATAMAVSGTVILMALCRQRPIQQQPCHIRPCIASGGALRKGVNRPKEKKRVRFGENMIIEFDDVCDDDDDDEEEEEEIVESVQNARRGGSRCELAREMPANRAALYSGMMQDRLRRMACY